VSLPFNKTAHLTSSGSGSRPGYSGLYPLFSDTFDLQVKTLTVCDDRSHTARSSGIFVCWTLSHTPVICCEYWSSGYMMWVRSNKLEHIYVLSRGVQPRFWIFYSVFIRSEAKRLGRQRPTTFRPKLVLTRCCQVICWAPTLRLFKSVS
jgi:hypothetical protein